MLRHKHIDRICCIVLAATLALTCAYMGAAASGLIEGSGSMGYEKRLFDQERVHTVDIVMDDWEGFLETCTNEEYAACTVVIDGEAFGSVAIRAKGNTSLSSVASYGNNRYSFKIEFDHYESGKSYYGLDKLSLNNLIQDSTHMKDYLAYTLMNKMGVAAPLCSFVQVNVNGEAWGLYLAVEAVEDSFLVRNYGSDHGELYKPDSMSMGGGRGNGRAFDAGVFDDMFSAQESESGEVGTASPDAFWQSVRGQRGMSRSRSANDTQTGEGEAATGGFDPGQMMMGGFDPNQMAGGNFGFNQLPGGSFSPNQMLSGIFNEEFDWTTLFGENFDITSLMNGEFNLADYVDEDFDVSQIFSDEFDPTEYFGEDFEYSDMLEEGFDWSPLFTAIANHAASAMRSMGNMGGGFGGMGSSDVMLQYIDDDPSSYSNIFDSAKTDVSKEDQERLIEALRRLSEGESLEEKLTAVDAEAVIRYLVVHHFMDNDDSYTGSMIHNYYLYEEDGALSMIPWDYNLSFGAFGMGGGFGTSSGATSSVNTPIDTPVSSGDISSRPILAWIFESEAYTELYHEIYQDFVDMCYTDGWLDSEIERVTNLIAPYVEADENAFFTYDEFLKGTETLREYCALRGESLQGQLDGSIPSTEEEQLMNSSALVDASHINVSDMGSMNMGGGRGGMQNAGGAVPEMPAGGGMTQPGGGDTNMRGMEQPAGGMMQPGGDTSMGGMERPAGGGMTLPGGDMNMGGMERPAGGGMTLPGGDMNMGGMEQPAGGMTLPGGGDTNMGGMEQPTGGMPLPGNTASSGSGKADGETESNEKAEDQPENQPAGETPSIEGADSGESAGRSFQSRTGFSGEMPDMEKGMNGGGNSSGGNDWTMLAISAAVLLAGLLFAGFHKSGR